ncbi:hypothetical protein J4E83_010853 [Alternaria metachromatica]|uniref:uncharacterized protein n=1 Tax=Alternaria metachromatica TaxID=283354 RepID=UPI0020C2595C|nr:uncharacterized protein J4E83_010853 [Alternaria metachromatica]KAI4605117.1 hypothetical protein J4E83_010853 [Alternaria metachromatica]
MASIRETIRNGASYLVGVIREKAQIQYEEVYLKLETHARVFKRSFQRPTPYIVAAGLNNVRDSSARTELRPRVKVRRLAVQTKRHPADTPKKQQNYHTVATGRIAKPKREPHPRELDPKWYDMAMKRKSAEEYREREMRLRENERRELAERKRRQQQKRHVPYKRTSMERTTGIKDKRPRWTSQPALPPPKAFSNLQHPAEFYENQTSEERRAYVREKLINVLGEEKMKEPILPSGHNPMEPVIAEHNQRMATISLLSQFEAHKVDVQRQYDEQIRLAREEEVTRLKTQILLGHYKDVYKGRINVLAWHTGHMLEGIDRLEHLLQTGEQWEVARVVQVLTHQVFEPVKRVLEEFDADIPLDPDGAQKLKEAWPMARLQALYDFLLGRSNNLDLQTMRMAQCIEEILRRLNNPTVFVDPLAPKPQPFSDLYQSFSSTNANTMANTTSQTASSLPGAVPPPAGGWSFRGRASTSGLDPDAPQSTLTNATTSAPPGSGISKLYAATASNAASKAAAPQIPSITIEPGDSAARTSVLQYISTDNMVLQAEMDDMFRHAEPKNSHRRAVTECIKGLVNAAGGEDKVLGTMDASYYRAQIEECVKRIDGLAKRYKEVKETKALRKLCGLALKIWAVHG